jgi:hypothetical protein
LKNRLIPFQYEREKQLRKCSDQKLLEIEDSFDGERKESTVKIESLTSIVKMFELKSKNSQDHSESQPETSYTQLCSRTGKA